jgi:hypothetical protein
MNPRSGVPVPRQPTRAILLAEGRQRATFRSAQEARMKRQRPPSESKPMNVRGDGEKVSFILVWPLGRPYEFSLLSPTPIT